MKKISLIALLTIAGFANAEEMLSNYKYENDNFIQVDAGATKLRQNFSSPEFSDDSIKFPYVFRLTYGYKLNKHWQFALDFSSYKKIHGDYVVPEVMQQSGQKTTMKYSLSPQLQSFGFSALLHFTDSSFSPYIGARATHDRLKIYISDHDRKQQFLSSAKAIGVAGIVGVNIAITKNLKFNFSAESGTVTEMKTNINDKTTRIKIDKKLSGFGGLRYDF